jgi:hypothetical protein
MISRTATRTKISPPRQGRSNPGRPKTTAIDHAVRVVHSVCCLSGSASLIHDIRADLRAEGIPSAIQRHDTATLFDWLVAALSYQGISNQVAAEYIERHGSATWADIDQKAGQNITCPRLKSYCPPCSRMFLFAIRPQLRCPASSLLRPKKALQTRVSRLLDILDNKDEVGRVIFVWPACRLRQSTHRRSILRRPAAVCHPPAHPPFRLFRSTPVCLIG